MGQNLYAGYPPPLDFERAVQKWYDEKADYDYDTNSCRDGAVCGHYTQVILQNGSE